MLRNRLLRNPWLNCPPELSVLLKQVGKAYPALCHPGPTGCGRDSRNCEEAQRKGDSLSADKQAHSCLLQEEPQRPGHAFPKPLSDFLHPKAGKGLTDPEDTASLSKCHEEAYSQ